MSKKVAFVSLPNPSLEEYINFHGMLCSPRIAQCCVNSFDGTVLFMPNTYIGTPLEQYDVTRPVLSVFSYYLLVLVTSTGLSTALKLTKLQCAQLENDKPITGPIASKSNWDLIADESVWKYILEQSQTQDLKLTKRFEYSFCGGSLSLLILHITCGRNLLHLVEVYRFQPRPLRVVYSLVLSTALFVARNVFAIVPKKMDD